MGQGGARAARGSGREQGRWISGWGQGRLRRVGGTGGGGQSRGRVGSTCSRPESRVLDRGGTRVGPGWGQGGVMVGVTRVKLRVVVFTGPTIGWTCSRPAMSEEAESEM